VRAALPENEAERLAALSRYNALDTAPEAAYDRITRTAKRVFDAPICLITLVDGTRQFFKSKIGVEITETPREQAFCAHGLLQDEPLVVNDATLDQRFADNPLVTQDPNIRFYAGAQLKTSDGFKLGSLCVIDDVPRANPSAEQLCILEDLAAQVIELLESGKGRQDLRHLQTSLEGVQKELVSDRKRFQRMEQMAELALDAGRMGYWEWDVHTRQCVWSERMFRMMGLGAANEAPSTDQWLALVHPADQSRLRTHFDKVRPSNDAFSIKFRVPPASGSAQGEERSLTMVGNHYYVEDGTADKKTMVGALGVAWDSGEADRRERALAESEEMFRGLSASCPVGIFKTNLQGDLVYANQRLAEICGTAVEKLLGSEWVECIHPEDVDEVRLCVLDGLKTERGLKNEIRLLLPDGTVRWCFARAAIVHDQAGNATGMVGTVDDITSRKKTLAELHAAKETAEIASRSKDIFLTNVSHELRTPLNGVLGMADLLLDTDLSPEQRQMSEIMRDSGQSLLRVVNDILDLSRVQACKLEIENIPFDWVVLLRQVVDYLKPDAAKKGIALKLEQPANMPTRFVGDAERIRQILLVYLTNALKFTEAGSVTVNVSALPVSEEAFELTVMVRDTGPGIPQGDQSKLFQPFSQLDPSITRRHGGIGVGLAIARRLAELMGGSVGVVSSEGSGATFWLRLTLPPASDPTAQLRQRIALPARVLVVEDNTESQRVALSMLWKLGWQADLVSDGLVAVEMIRRNDYAVVFMDCQMPRLDGYTATEEVRKWEKTMQRAPVPIVALTAHAMAGDRERCFNAGMNDYLAKPLGLDNLRRALNQWSGNSPASLPSAMLA
jgi:PAS domain S-box-containing protein